MQATAEQFQTELWSKLQAVYDKYLEKPNQQISTSKVEQIVYEVLGQQTQQQIDYVIKNMFRLDTDLSGGVSFLEFANFLFKRHCGQMSLQKMHLKNLMSHGVERKMTNDQFYTLMNNAYKFLNVACSKEVTTAIFEETDTDKDQLITYVQYFQIIDKYVCRKTVPKPTTEIVDQGPERFSKLRLLLWKNLRLLYEAYVSGRHLQAGDAELKGLILAIVGELSQVQLTFLLTEIFKLDFKTIEFNPFASNFLYLIGKLGLSRFQQNYPGNKKTLTKFQFVILFKNTYKFLGVSKIKDEFLWLHFAKIDKNHDGLISFEEYLDWIRRFIAVVQYFGDQFYIEEDDQNSKYDINQVEPPVKIQPPKKTIIRFTFSDLSLAYQVRKKCFELFQKFDVNKDKLFDQKQIHTALTQLLKQDQWELAYVTRNVFRYDRDGDKNVTYDQMTNFMVEQHFGQMAIQRLHKKSYYSKGKQRMMNQQEFAKTLIYALSFIQITPSDEILKLLFKEIDLDNDGWISYEVYFLFLRYYFGSLSQAGKVQQPQEKKLSKDEQFLLSLKDLSPFDRFVRILLNQLKALCLEYDYNRNLVFEADQIQAILINIFSLSQNQVSYVIYQYFRFSSRKQQYVTYEEMIAIILEIYFIQILFRRKYKSDNSQNWKNKLLNLEQFIALIWDNCFFIRVRPPKQDLKAIFQVLDTNKDGFISFKQYFDFIRKYLGRGLVVIDFTEKKQNKDQSKPTGISEEQLAFVQALWGELKKYFDQYDKGAKTFLNEEQLKAFAVEVLKQTSKRQLQYIFWNLFRVDSNLNRQVDFGEFAPFILSHAAQISLQRFHREQTKGKNSLSEQELFIVLKNAYSFLSTMPKSQNVVKIIFNRISTNGSVAYSGFLGWVVTLSRKFK